MWFIYIVVIALLIPVAFHLSTQWLVLKSVDRYTDLPNLHAKQSKIRGFPDLQHVVYINLAKRPDRRALVEAELGKVGWKPERIDGVDFTPGVMGCIFSHIKSLEYAKARKWPHVLICEDDVQFTRSPSELQMQLNQFFLQHSDWDVVLLGCTVLDGTHVTPSCVRVQKAYAAHCYLIREEYYDVLLHNYRQTIDKKDETPLDVSWHSLQKRDRWLMPYPMLAVQRASFSDIYRTDVDYTQHFSEGLNENIAY
jgi:hypothetical protein